MKPFLPYLYWCVAGIPLLAMRSQAAVPNTTPDRPQTMTEPVKLNPLNHPTDNLFAGHRSHRSHSSHRSHASHRSGSGGHLSAPVLRQQQDRLAPQYETEPATTSSPSTISPEDRTKSGAERARVGSSSSSQSNSAPMLTLKEMRRLQVMRVQIALTTLGLFSGQIDGVFSQETSVALKRFQLIKGLPESGLMTTESLNALGVPAVH